MDVVSLHSGRQVAIRPIRPSDGPALQAAYDRLSPLSKYRRFLSPKPHLTRQDARYLAHVDGRDHVALVATPLGDPDWIIAAARFVRLPEDGGAAEISVVVGDRFQHDGLGSLLLSRLARVAAERGINRFRATLLAENGPARRLVRGLAGDVARERADGPVHELEIELAS